MNTKSTAEKYEFQSEIRQLLSILVYSLYKHKDVFVRELVSNAVDALNKVQFESLIREDVEDGDAELRIDIGFNESQSKLIIEDSGVGMTKEELIENIGTIAHSGTMDFLKRLAETFIPASWPPGRSTSTPAPSVRAARLGCGNPRAMPITRSRRRSRRSGAHGSSFS